jgi:hypothetical protein
MGIGHWALANLSFVNETTLPVVRAGSGAHPLPIRWSTPLAAILISVEVLKHSFGVNARYS